MFVGVSFCRCTFGFSILWPFLLFHIRLLGLADSLYDEIKSLPLEEDFGEQTTSFSSGSRKLKKRKVFHSIRWTYIYVMFSIATLAFALIPDFSNSIWHLWEILAEEALRKNWSSMAQPSNTSMHAPNCSWEHQAMMFSRNFGLSNWKRFHCFPFLIFFLFASRDIV